MKKKGLSAACLVVIFDQHRASFRTSQEARFIQLLPGEAERAGGSGPDRSEVALSGSLRSDKHQHSDSPVRPLINCSQRVQIGWRRQKILTRETRRMRPAKRQLARPRHHGLSDAELPR